MDTFVLQALATFIFTIGLTLGVGSSTFALTFFIRALEDGAIDPSEKRFLHTVYVVLRLGMITIAFGLVATLLAGQALPLPQYAMQWTLLGVITLNALLMTVRVMPMSVGPVLAGGSWYSLFWITALPLGGVAYPALLIYYGGFLIAFFIVWTYLKKRFTHPPQI